MKVRATTDPVIGFTLMTAVALSIVPFNASTFGQDARLPNPQGQTNKPAWLDGSGKDLRIKVTGEVFDENGAPADRYKLEVRLETRFGQQDLPVKIAGNRFEVWVPVGNVDWLTLHVKAASADGRQFARIPVSIHELRQAAIDGLTMKMKNPERLIEIKVVANGRTLPDASVAVEFAGDRIIGKTNSAGVATFPVMNRDKLSQLTAWTDDFRIGGYSLDRNPPRDPMGDKFSIELDRCRPQTIRIINDDDKSPVPNLGFVLTIMTGPPDYQFPGETPDRAMRTDANGEAVYRWFPDWKRHHSYVEITDPRWVKATDEHVVDVVRVRKSQFEKRKRIAGTVASADGNVAGFAVSISSFQGEENNQMDVLYAVSDEHGDFAADYLPGATYCICINDARFVSNIIDLIPYEPTTGKITRPSLKISAGQPVEIVVTAGAEKRPVAHQRIGLETPHDYSWREDGRTQNGSGGRRWQVFTNEQGKADTFALPGRELKGSLHSPEWRSERSVQVKTVGVTRLEFHQKVATKRKLVGRLLLADNLDTSVEDAVVEIGSIDGETHERQTLNANPDGQIALQSQASRIGIYARTKDAKVAGVAIVDHLDKPIELQLRPTGEFHGQLLGKEDHPLQGHAVRAVLYVSGKRDNSNGFPTGFDAATFESKTDAEGNYSLTGLPCEVVLSLRADSIDGSDGESELEKFYLVPNESRPRTVNRLWKPQTTRSFSERYGKTFRDCRLSDSCAMVILFRPSDDTTRFVDANLMDDERTKEVSSFIQLEGLVGGDATTDESTAFVRSRNWPMPKRGKVLACAIDPTGKELGRVELDAKDLEGPTQAAQFIRKHAPKPVDAREKWEKAFAVAKQMNRKVWVRVSQRYCGPCFLLARWLDDEKEILEQDYVLLKIDDVRDLHGPEVAKRVTGGGQYGVPFCAIFDADGRMLINSNSPIGNIGYPSGFEGKKHLRRMLMETHKKLTDKQIEEIVASLKD